MYLAVVHSKADYGFHFLAHQVFEHAVVVALVGAAHYPDHRPCLAFERVPGGIYVGGLRVVYVHNVADAQHGLQAVFDGGEALEGVAYYLVFDAGGLGCQRGGHGVVYVVTSAEGKFAQIDFALALLVPDYDAVAVHPCSLLKVLLLL